MSDALKPSPALLCKLGSIVVHVEEANAPGGHTFDVVATQQLMADPEVQEWLEGMRKMAMVPVKRTDRAHPAQPYVKSHQNARKP